MDEVARQVHRFILRHGLLSPDERVVVALSGGPDSIALTLILAELTREGVLPLRLRLAHLDHGLRGAESERDAAFCRDFAQRHGLELSAESIDVSQEAVRLCLSLEAAARHVRYAFLGRVAEQAGACAVLTGHQADDVAETVLLRLIRGAGVPGLGAMAPTRPFGRARPELRLVRPLLATRKARLRRYLADRGQTFCADSTNLQTAYTRNRVRHSLMPFLRQQFPWFSVESLCALNESAVETRAMLEEMLEARWAALCREAGPEAVLLDARQFAELPPPLRKMAADRALDLLTEDAAPGLKAEHYRAFAALGDRDPGVEASLPGGFRARREHDLVLVGPSEEAAPLPERALPVPGAVELPEIPLRVSAEVLDPGDVGPEEALERSSAHEVYVDVEAVGRSLRVRSRRPGDAFHPLGAPGGARLKKFLIGRRAPRHVRERIPLVVTSADEIAWVVGYQIAEPFKVTPRTGAVLRLRAEPCRLTPEGGILPDSGDPVPFAPG